jgi:hypothetical protein
MNMQLCCWKDFTMHSANDAGEASKIESLDLLWGANEIARVLGLKPRQAFHLLNSGKLKSAWKLGGRWYASRRELISEVLNASQN